MRGNSRGRFFRWVQQWFAWISKSHSCFAWYDKSHKNIESNALALSSRGQEDQLQGAQQRDPANPGVDKVGQYENYSTELIKTATFQARKLESCPEKWNILKIIRGFGIHFKMDTLKLAINLVTPECTFLSLDFHAYYIVPVAEPHQKYLKFQYQGVIYKFNVLPNVLSSAPRLFTKILKVPLSFVRQNTGLDILGYLDGTLLPTRTTLTEITTGCTVAIETFTEFGFAISRDKSVLMPTKRIEFLGFVLDSKEMYVSIGLCKAIKIKELLMQMLQKQSCSIR